MVKKTIKLLSICICAVVFISMSLAANASEQNNNSGAAIAALADEVSTDSAIENTTGDGVDTSSDSSIGTSTDPAIDFDDGNHIVDIWFDADSEIPHQKTFFQGENLSYRIFLGDEVDASLFNYIQLNFKSTTGKTVQLISNLADNQEYYNYYTRYNAVLLTATSVPEGTYVLEDVLFLDANRNVLSNLGVDKRAVVNNENHVIQFTVLKNESTVEVKKSVSTAYLPVGKTYLLNAYVDGQLQNAEDFYWYTSESDIASVVGDGEIKSVARGNATIRVVSKTDENVYGYINLPCYTYITSLKLNYLNNNVKVGNSFTLKASMNSTATFKDLTWTSSDPTVVTVTNKGVVQGKNIGSATITAKANDASGKKVTCLVIVSNMVIVLDPGHGGSDPGATGHGLKERDLNYKIAYYLEAELKKYYGLAVFKTHNTFTGSLALDTRVSRAKGYKADLLVSLHNNAGSSTAKGSEVIISRYTGSTRFNKNSYALGSKILTELNKLGLKKRTVYSRVTSTKNKYGNGQLQDYYGIVRNGVLMGVPSIIVEHAFVSSSDYVFLNTNAKLKKIALADAKGIANHYGLISKSNVIELKSVALNRTSGTLHKSLSYTLKPVFSPSIARINGMVWSSSNQSVATVNSKGTITAKSVGKATIKLTVNGKVSASYQLNVIYVPVKSISLTRPSTVLSVNHRMQLRTSTLPSNATNKKYTFTTSNRSIATVDAKGVVTGRKAGTVRITVKSSGEARTATVTLSVRKVLVKSIRTNYSSVNMYRGRRFRIGRIVYPSNASNRSVIFKTSNRNVALISAAGVVTARKAGRATITITARDGSRVYKRIIFRVR